MIFVFINTQPQPYLLLFLTSGLYPDTGMQEGSLEYKFIF